MGASPRRRAGAGGDHQYAGWWGHCGLSTGGGQSSWGGGRCRCRWQKAAVEVEAVVNGMSRGTNRCKYIVGPHRRRFVHNTGPRAAATTGTTGIRSRTLLLCRHRTRGLWLDSQFIFPLINRSISRKAFTSIRRILHIVVHVNLDRDHQY